MPRSTDKRKGEEVRFRKLEKRRLSQTVTLGQAVKAAQRGEIVLEVLRLDCGTQSRAIINPETIDGYAEAMRDGVKFPPIIVFYDGTNYLLVDGFHRVSAAQIAGLKALPVDLRQGTLRDAILFSTGVNATHGLPRTSSDKRRAIERLLRDDEWGKWSDREIARRVGVHHSTVSSVRTGLIKLSGEISQIRITERNGTQYQINTAKIGTSQRTNDLSPQQVIRPSLPTDMPVELLEAHDAGQISATDAIAIFGVLQRAPDEVVSLVLIRRIFLVEKVSILSSLYGSAQSEHSNKTFYEIADSGGFHYGDGMGSWCDFAQDDLKTIYAALRSISLHHKRLASDVREAARSAVPAQLSGPLWDLRKGDFVKRMLELPVNSVDCIITDPPYPKEYLPLYAKLAAMGNRVLKRGGSLFVMCGQSYLPAIFQFMTTGQGLGLDYHWTLCYLTLGGQSPQIWDRKVNTFWKPILWFVKGANLGDWHGDVIKSERNEKDAHHWQQSISGMSDLVHKFTLPDHLIVDPFCGSGTTGVACVTQSRRFIGIDTDTAALAAASERLMACTTAATIPS